MIDSGHAVKHASRWRDEGERENQTTGDISKGHRYHVKKFLVAMMEEAEQNIKSRDLKL